MIDAGRLVAAGRTADLLSATGRVRVDLPLHSLSRGRRTLDDVFLDRAAARPESDP